MYRSASTCTLLAVIWCFCCSLAVFVCRLLPGFGSNHAGRCIRECGCRRIATPARAHRTLCEQSWQCARARANSCELLEAFGATSCVGQTTAPVMPRATKTWQHPWQTQAVCRSWNIGANVAEHTNKIRIHTQQIKQ